MGCGDDRPILSAIFAWRRNNRILITTCLIRGAFGKVKRLHSVLANPASKSGVLLNIMTNAYRARNEFWLLDRVQPKIGARVEGASKQTTGIEDTL